MLHMATISQIRLDTEGRTYYRGNLEALRCLKREISHALYRELIDDAARPRQRLLARPGRARRGVSGLAMPWRFSD